MFQDAANPETFHAGPESTDPFLVLKKVSVNINQPATKHISNFEFLSNDYKNIIETNRVLPTEIINGNIYQDKNIKNKTIKINGKVISKKNRKSAPKHKINKDKHRNNKTLAAIERL